MTPKELIDKITLAAEQLESLRTEHDLPVRVEFEDGEIAIRLSNKARMLEAIIYESSSPTYRALVLGRYYLYNTYEELVEDIKNR